MWEYPVLMVLALLCRPGAFADGVKPWLRDGGLIAAGIVLLVVPGSLFKASLPQEAGLVWMIVLVISSAIIMLQASHPARLTGLVAAILIITSFYQPGKNTSETMRSFLGVHKVVKARMGASACSITALQPRRAAHPGESGAPVSGRPEPLTYYHNRGPMAEAVAAVRANKGELDRVMVVGLGTGSLACHAKPGERWTYFEIDAVVIRLAQDRSKFSFLHECAPGSAIVLGDARLTLADVNELADVIVLDAFSSNVIPVHLLTREALDLYVSKLAPGGALVFHISNRYVELASVLTAMAAERGLIAMVKFDQSVQGRGIQAHDEVEFAGCSHCARRARSRKSARWMDETQGRPYAAPLDTTIFPMCLRPCGGCQQRNSSIHQTDSRAGTIVHSPLSAHARPCPQLRHAPSIPHGGMSEIFVAQRFPCRTIAQIVAGFLPVIPATYCKIK